MIDWGRRQILFLLGLGSAALGYLAFLPSKREVKNVSTPSPPLSKASAPVNPVLERFPINFRWGTADPFLFCVHHLDHYPKGNGKWGPNESLEGRNIGQDFEAKNGYRMYHGEQVPGFPVHPHRGFETITIVRRGLVDHADSLGAAGRYGNGDVQWMTAGSGVQHSEMFPLLSTETDNTLELFQIWINLPKIDKMAPPHFTMFWNEKIPVVEEGGARLTLIAGEYAGRRALDPPPNSWASQENSHVKIWLVRLEEESYVHLPAEDIDVNRLIYHYNGQQLNLNGQPLLSGEAARLDGRQTTKVTSTGEVSEFLLLQGRPLNEPTVQHGPFVMNSQAEIVQAIEDYRKTRFGGWPWKREDMVHGDGFERFALFPDGRRETPG